MKTQLFSAVVLFVSTLSAAFAQGTITGRVTSASTGDGIAGIKVVLYILAGSQFFGQYDVTTDGEGNYSFAGQDIMEGTYWIGFLDQGETYVPEYYDNALSEATATPFTIGEETLVFNAQLDLAAQVTGTVTTVIPPPDEETPPTIQPLEGIQVNIYRKLGPTEFEYTTFVDTESDGTYNLRGLIPGTYVVEFVDNDGIGTQYARQYNNQKISLFSADEIVLTTGVVISGVNGVLVGAGGLTGTVTDEASNPLGNITAIVYLKNGDAWEAVAATETNSAGDYLFIDLPPVQLPSPQTDPPSTAYRVGFLDVNGNYAGEFYNEAVDIDTAQDVEVFAYDYTLPTINLTTGINGSLALAGPPAPPMIQGIYESAPGEFVLEFTGQPGFEYQLESSTTLSGWADEGSSFICQEGVNEIPVTLNGTKTFWRVYEIP